MFLAAGLVVSAQGNAWDNAPPIVFLNGGGGGGADAYNPGGSASLDTTGAIVHVP